jgi:hypothetical protein
MATEQHTTCPVAVIAAEAEKVEAEIKVADESFDSKRLDRLMDQRFALHDAASYLPAQSMKGTEFHIDAIESLVDELQFFEPDDSRFNQFNAIRRMIDYVRASIRERAADVVSLRRVSEPAPDAA